MRETVRELGKTDLGDYFDFQPGKDQSEGGYSQQLHGSHLTH